VTNKSLPKLRCARGVISTQIPIIDEALMKLLTLALSAATLLALAASAAQAASHHHSRNYRGAYAYRGPVNAGRVGSPGPIYKRGHYLGTDPDPSVRYQINRDPYDGRP
jgi:hypothetical protein